MAQQLNVSLLITANASGVSATVTEVRKEVDAMGGTARTTQGALDKLAVSNDAAAAATRRAGEAARGRSVAEREVAVAVASAINSNNAYSQSAGMARMQTSNLAFQIQDIGTMMASGQNPFILLAQQLPQITMYGGQLGGVMGALRSTVAGLFSPLGLLTTGFVLAGSAAISYFSDAGDEAGDADKALREHQDEIARVAKEWGDAIPALRAYADEMERTRSATERDAAIKQRQAELYADFNSRLPDLRAGIGAVIQTLQQLGDETGAADDLFAAFKRLDERVKQNKASVSDYQAVQDALTSIMATYSTPAVEDLAAEIDALALSYRRAAAGALELDIQNQALKRPARRRAEDDSLAELNAIDQANTRFIAEQTRLNGLTAEQLKLETEIARVKADVERSGGFLGQDQIREIAQANIAADERQRPRRARRSSAERAEERYDDIIANAEAAIAAQRLEAEAYGMTEIAAERLRQQQILLNQARTADIALTPEQTERLRELGSTLADVTAETERQGEALAERKGMWGDVVGGLRDAARDGKIELQELGDIGMRVVDRLVDKMETDLVDALANMGGFGGGSASGVNIFASIFRALFGGATPANTNATASAAWSGLRLDSGGYTGAGGRLQVAGTVHRDEFVFSSPAVRTIGVSRLDRMHKAAKSGRGFDDGGWTGGKPENGAPGAGWPSGPLVEIKNYSTAEISQREKSDGRGGRRLLMELSDTVSAGINKPGSSLDKALARRGAKQVLTRR